MDIAAWYIEVNTEYDVFGKRVYSPFGEILYLCCVLRKLTLQISPSIYKKKV
jgi:hypothetical protein